jgi:hypothetical protein
VKREMNKTSKHEERKWGGRRRGKRIDWGLMKGAGEIEWEVRIKLSHIRPPLSDQFLASCTISFRRGTAAVRSENRTDGNVE